MKNKFSLAVIVGLLVLVGTFFWSPRTKNPLLESKKTTEQTTFSSEGGDLKVNDFPNPQVLRDLGPARQEAEELNAFIYAMKPFEIEKSHASVLKAAQQITDYAKTHPNSQAARYYAAFAKLVPELKSILWRLGGIVGQTEPIYIAVVGSLQSIAYNRHLYSEQVKRMFDYVTIPDVDSTRFASFTDFQNYLTNKFIPLAEESLKELKTLYQQSANGFEFQYDRTLVAGGNRKDHNQGDRWARFIRPYLAATIFYSELHLGFFDTFVSYDMDLVPSFLNEVMWNSVVKSKIRALDVSQWTKDGFNVKINGTADYREILGNPKYATLFTLRKQSDLRGRALKYYQEAQRYNLDYIGQMRAFARMPNQDEYVVDAKELIEQKENQPERFEKLARTMFGRESFTDPVSGKSVTVNFPALFALKEEDLKSFYPYSDKPGSEKLELGKTKKSYFNYTHGRADRWNDPSFGGFLEGVRDGKEVFEAHRILSYSEDGDVLANTIMPFLM